MGKLTRYFHEDETSDKKEVRDSNEVSTKVKVYKVNQKRILPKKKQVNKKIIVKIPNPNPKFPGRAPIPKELLEKHSRGSGINKSGIKTKIHRQKFQRKEANIEFSNKQAARVEILLTEEPGYLEADTGETTTQFTQEDIVKNVDITAASKHFDLILKEFGPYRAKYTRNGRHLLLGGKKGHVAAFDWVSKKLHCELNVMESVHDICWLHIETMFAVAQKNWVYIYDNQGIELHCLKRLNKISQMEFLPYHFLLATSSEEGYLSWLDVSIGQLVGNYNTKLGRMPILTQNPYNAVICAGHTKGVVTMWAPKTRDPLAKMLCHNGPITAINVDPKGTYMVTSGVDKKVKIWDIRKLNGPIQLYQVPAVANNVSFSQKNMLAIGMGNVVDVYKDCCATAAHKPYLRHHFNSSIRNFNFCPYEDVLGVATDWGFTSLLVPGCGEANYDAYEANPYQSKSQRREFEVKSLLEKIQPELISLDPTVIVEVDVPTLKRKVEAKKNLLFLKPPKIDYEPRNKAKGKGGSVKIARNKKIVREQVKKDFIKDIKEIKKQDTKENNVKDKKQQQRILDRFLPKK